MLHIIYYPFFTIVSVFQTLSKMVKEMNIKGFSDVSVATDVTEGICSL